ncbi:DUF2059 domain-containing protein [Puniceicoccus vermicola]|uniref:DUF2059 domain-containing protein n=1 Tax=Puniceicoccus vermicola TaxID=388746 RepID=A0A7X1AWP1_9BACT|nr:DUF2059 domain-containing protein [Puniceicoccus vermicola]MBC2601366.1 DUF2059 domain-containing protein [Puniceicoccus vermicola]
MNRCWIALPLFLLGSFTSTFAEDEQTPSKESIVELLDLMETKKIIDQTMDQMEQVMEVSINQATQGKPLDEEEQAQLDQTREAMNEWLREELNYDFLLKMYVPSFEETFTQTEVDQLIEFYSSPVGQMFVQKQPKLMQSFMQRYQQQIGPMMQRFQQKLQENLDEVSTTGS